MMKDRLILIDSHCDTLWALSDSEKELYENTKMDLYENNLHFDLKSVSEYAGYIQFFAAWIDKKLDNSLAQCLRLADRFYTEAEKNKEYLIPVYNAADIEKAINQKKTGAILSIEGGEALSGDLGVLRMLYKTGFRSVCLTWNYRNEIGDPAIDTKSANGLSGFGKETVREMNDLGMIIDVSHLNERGFYDVLELSEAPIMATHSCSKTLCAHFRNLTDDQFKALAANNGVVGINFCPAFLEDDENATVASIVRHIEHFMSLGGENHIGIGSDFDGIDNLPAGINKASDTSKIFDALLKLGYADSQIEKIAYKNTLRVIKDVLK